MTTSDASKYPTRFIDFSELETRLAETIAEVSSANQEFVITQNGKPVSRLTAYEPLPGDEKTKRTMVFGEHRDQIQILGDIVSPMPVEWYAKDDDNDEELF